MSDDDEKLSIEDRFVAFHRDNPHVYTELVRLARRARDRGYQRVGIAMLWETIRWNRMMETTPDQKDDRKMNNDFRSRYARLIMSQEADLANIFDLRHLRAE